MYVLNRFRGVEDGMTWVAFRFQASAPDQTMSSAAKIFHAEEQILLVIVCQDPFVQSETDD